LSSLGLVAVVPGAALQLGVAREAAAGGLGGPAPLAGSLVRWRRLGLAVAVACGAAAAALRGPLAELVSVADPWAVACLAPAPALWLVLGAHRGALQGAGRHGAVALSLLVEGGARLVLAGGLVAAGAGVTGAIAATPLALLAALGFLAVRARRRLGAAGTPRRGALRGVFAQSWMPVSALVLLAAIQQLDVVVAKHRLGASADSYIAAAVLSKAIVWAAAGLALALLPEVSRQVRAGIAGPGRLARTLVLVVAIAAPLSLVSIVAAGPLLRLVFGGELSGAADALPWLAVAMSLFACAFVAVEHALATAAPRALGLLAAIAVAEPLALVQAGRAPVDLAGAVALAQLALAVAALVLGLRRTAPVRRAEAA
jgi:O-antigen/teichoic acid export membrane protein